MLINKAIKIGWRVMDALADTAERLKAWAAKEPPEKAKGPGAAEVAGMLLGWMAFVMLMGWLTLTC